MMLKNLSSFTVPTGPYPAYVSFNEALNGDVEVTARAPSPDGLPGDLVLVTIPREEAREMFREAARKLRVNA